MTPFDLAFVRRQFPAFGEPSLEGFAHFENAGGSYACRQVIDRLDGFYRETKVQPYYAFEPSRRAGEEMDAAKARMAAWLGVGGDELLQLMDTHIQQSAPQGTDFGPWHY